MLAIAVAVSGYVGYQHGVPNGSSVRLTPVVEAEGLILGQGGRVGDVNVGRLGTIVQPVSVPTTEITTHDALEYTVQPNDDLKSLASRYNLSPEHIRWSNPQLKDTEKLTPGDKLLIPPVPGIVVVAKKGDTVQSLAEAFKVAPTSISDFNYLRDGNLYPGQRVIVPGGQGPDLDQSAQLQLQALSTRQQLNDFGRVVSRAAQAVTGPRTGYSQPVIGGAIGALINPKFPWGWCTWYVATRRNVTWMGNAWEWYGNARAQGYPVGQTPRAGAIMVTWESGWGHVAYVEQVNADGSWDVSEANFVGFGVVSRRHIKYGQVPLIGFIY